MWNSPEMPAGTALPGRQRSELKRPASGPDEIERGEPPLEGPAGIHPPPAVERGGVEAAEIDRERQVAIAVQGREIGPRPVQPPLYAAAHDEMGAGRAVIGAVRLVLARA